MTLVMVAAFALPAMAQVEKSQPSAVVFQSTSTMTGSGSALSANPTLNADGTASLNSSGGGPRRAKMDGTGSPSTPGQGEQENQFPLGDAVWPLMAMLAVYCAARVYRRRRV